MNDKLNFEDGLRHLADIVDQLENGTETLDDMIKLYEEAINLAEKLSVKLSKAETRVEDLSERLSGVTSVANDEEHSEEEIEDLPLPVEELDDGEGTSNFDTEEDTEDDNVVDEDGSLF